MKPITPKEAAKKANIPDLVIRAFNELITKKLDGNQAIIKQDDVIERIQELERKYNSPVSREFIFEQGWLNVETIFERAGWDVKYDKPGYNETYSASFIFTAK